jgi:hypothetical protein
MLGKSPMALGRAWAKRKFCAATAAMGSSSRGISRVLKKDSSFEASTGSRAPGRLTAFDSMSDGTVSKIALTAFTLLLHSCDKEEDMSGSESDS